MGQQIINPRKRDDRKFMEAHGLKNRKQLRKYRKKQMKARMQNENKR